MPQEGDIWPLALATGAHTVTIALPAGSGAMVRDICLTNELAPAG